MSVKVAINTTSNKKKADQPDQLFLFDVNYSYLTSTTCSPPVFIASSLSGNKLW